MKPPRQKREETASATLVPTLVGIFACSMIFTLAAYATDPSWWSDREYGTQPAVMPEQVVTNLDGSVVTNYVPNDYAVVLQGQLKQFAARADDHMYIYLPGDAGSAFDNLWYDWYNDYQYTNYDTATNPFAPYKPSDFTAMTVGQLKYIANIMYDQLISSGYTGLNPTWLAANTNDTALATIGQLKTVFNFDLSVGPPPITGVTASTNGDGSIVLNWTNPSINNATSTTISETADGGLTWTQVAVLDPTSTSYTSTNLVAGDIYLVSNGNSNGSNFDLAIVPGTNSIPSSPSGLTGGYNAQGQMSLSWPSVSGAAFYSIDQENVATGQWQTNYASSITPSFSDTNAAVNHTYGYAYRVNAVSSGGSSAPSAPYPSATYAVIDMGPLKGSANGYGPLPTTISAKFTTSGKLFFNGYITQFNGATMTSAQEWTYTNGSLQMCGPVPGAVDVNDSGVFLGTADNPGTAEDGTTNWDAPVMATYANLGQSTGTVIPFKFLCTAPYHTGDPDITPDPSSFQYGLGRVFPVALGDDGTAWSIQPVDFNPAYPADFDGSPFICDGFQGANELGLSADEGTNRGSIVPVAVNGANDSVTYSCPGNIFEDYLYGYQGGLTPGIPGEMYLTAPQGTIDLGSQPYWPTPVAYRISNRDANNVTRVAGGASWWDTAQHSLPFTNGSAVGINAATATVNGANVPAFQIVGSCGANPGVLWQMDPGTQVLGQGQDLSAMLSPGGGWSGLIVAANSDSNLIVGTATYTSSSNPPSGAAPANGPHAVGLLPMELVQQTTTNSGVYTHIDAAPIFPADNGVGRGAPANQGSPKGVFVMLNADLTTAAVGSMSVSIGGPSGYFSGTLTETAANSGVFQDSASTVTFTLPVGTTTSATAIDALKASVTSSSIGLSNATVSLVESGADSLYFSSPIASSEIIFSSTYNPSIINSIHLNLSLQASNFSGAESSNSPITLTLSETSAGSKTFVDAASGLTVTLTNFTGTNSGSIDGMVASFSGGAAGSIALSTTLTETTATSMDFQSQITVGDTNSGAGTDVTPDDPQTSGDGVFYIRSSGTAAMTLSVQTDVGAAQQVTLNPDPNNPGSLISGKMILVPQDATGNTAYTSIPTVLQVAAPSSTAGAAAAVLRVHYPNTGSADIMSFEESQGMYLGMGLFPTDEAIARFYNSAGVAQEQVDNLKLVEAQASNNLKLAGCTLKDLAVNKADLLAAIPHARYLYLVCHSWCEETVSPTAPNVVIPFQDIAIHGNGREDVTFNDVQMANGQHKYQLVFIAACDSADTASTPPPGYPFSASDTNKVQAMVAAFNCQAYAGWDRIVDGAKSIRGGLAFFTALKGAVTVDQAGLAASQAAPAYVASDSAQCKSVKGGSLTGDQLAKPN